ncbi:MAG: hypothetical protein KatS3mg031_0947 [Chitinophagales bacterium]|nr:MAG: hypothetical protein KatS3mg031_0947 [Chitinophagales bacterium]
MPTLLDFVGWFGAIAVLYGYFMVSRGKLKGDSIQFQVANAIGAGCLVVYTYCLKAYPATALNLIWALIALVALWKKLQNR